MLTLGPGRLNDIIFVYYAVQDWVVQRCYCVICRCCTKIWYFAPSMLLLRLAPKSTYFIWKQCFFIMAGLLPKIPHAIS